MQRLLSYRKPSLGSLAGQVENILDQNGRVSVEWGVVEFSFGGGIPKAIQGKSGWLCEVWQASL